MHHQYHGWGGNIDMIINMSRSSKLKEQQLATISISKLLYIIIIIDSPQFYITLLPTLVSRHNNNEIEKRRVPF